MIVNAIKKSFREETFKEREETEVTFVASFQYVQMAPQK